MSTVVQGRIVNKRPLSRKLVFLHLERAQHHDLELVLKAAGSDTLDLLDVHTLRDALKVGDLVTAAGFLEAGETTLRVTSIKITEPWRANHPHTSFTPKLLPSLHKTAQKVQGPASSPAAEAAADNVQQGSLTQQALCKYWVNTGRCPRGATCEYQHVQPSELPELRQGWVIARRRHKQELSQEAGNPHGLDAARKGQRAAVFCDWLLATFGREVLNGGSGVLDIAGGRGDVSFELQTVRGIRCTLIDPRPQKMSKGQRRWLKQFAGSKQETTLALGEAESAAAVRQSSHTLVQHSTAGSAPATAAGTPVKAGAKGTTSGAAPATAQSMPTTAAPKLTTSESAPATVGLAATAEWTSPAADFRPATAEPVEVSRLSHAGPISMFEQSSATSSQGQTSDFGAGSAYGLRLHSRGVCAQLPASQSEACHPESCTSEASGQQRPQVLHGTLSHQIQAEFNPELWTEADMAKQLQACSLVLGLHPDQATDSIVDFAMQYGKPFAVVPCCVFPRQFLHREVKGDDGQMQPVSTHRELVAYLLQKSAGSKQYLAFEGMNQVVFRM